MGTSGYFGFCFKGVYFVVYNSYDSFFAGLGADLINEIIDNISNLKEWKEKLQVLLKKSQTPSEIDIAESEMKKETDPEKRKELAQKIKVLLNDFNASLKDIKSLSEILVPENFNSLSIGYDLKKVCDAFYDYKYIVDFDTNTFDVYEYEGLVGSSDLNGKMFV